MFKGNIVAFLVALIFSVALLAYPTAANPGPPVAAFTYSPAAPILGDIVTFNASTSTPDGGTIVSYTWNFGDGIGDSLSTPTAYHNYTTFGTYNVTLTVTDSESQSDTTWQIVIVREYPVAVFTYTPAWPKVGETVTFNASQSTPEGGTITSYYWDFDDDTYGTGITVYHNFTAVGTFNVTLTVTDNETLTDTTWDIVTVRDYPVAKFTYSPVPPGHPLVNEMVTFNASLSTPDNGTIISYFWDFGDNSSPVTEFDPITNHTYTTFGTFNVTLTITDSEDLTDDFSGTIRILIAPVANFTYWPPDPVFNETVIFNASASFDPDGSTSIVSYRWNFGDNSSPVTEFDPITNHTYTTFGTFNVTLTVTDDDGLTDTLWKLITVYTRHTHDVAIRSVALSATEVYAGRVIDITVVTKNEGASVESFTVTVYYNGINIDTKTVIGLIPSAQETLTFSWSTTGVAPGNYIISAQASTVPGETKTTNNILINGQVKIRRLGDVDGNDNVNVMDLLRLKIAVTLGRTLEEEPFCDVDLNDKINVMDMLRLKIIITLA